MYNEIRHLVMASYTYVQNVSVNVFNNIRNLEIHGQRSTFLGTLNILRAGWEGYVRNARAGNYRSILYASLSLLLSSGLFQSGYLMSAVNMATRVSLPYLGRLLQDAGLNWMNGTPAVGTSAPVDSAPIVPTGRDFESYTTRLLEVFTDFFMNYF